MTAECPNCMAPTLAIVEGVPCECSGAPMRHMHYLAVCASCERAYGMMRSRLHDFCLITPGIPTDSAMALIPGGPLLGAGSAH